MAVSKPSLADAETVKILIYNIVQIQTVQEQYK